MKRSVDRREFVRTAAASAGAIAAATMLGSCTEPSTDPDVTLARGGGGGGGKPKPVTRNPLNVPPTVSPAGLTLAPAPALVDLGDRTSVVWAYSANGGDPEFPAPTIVAARGERATIQLVNGLQQPTITHWHGMIVDHQNDGHPQFVIGPGGTYNYDFTINQRACLNWYHPHPHMLTGEQVAMGLAGAFIVRDSEEAGLGLPSSPYEVPLIVRDAKFDKSGNMEYTPKRGGFEGNTPLVNGTLNPFLAVDAGWYRFRILNGCNARIFRFALSNGASFTLIGNDGGLLTSAVNLAEIDLSPGERLDLLVDFGALGRNQTVMLRDLRAGWDLLEFQGTGAAGRRSLSLPGQLSTITSLGGAARTREFAFEGMSKINGKEYELDRIDFQVPFGQTELWRFSTKGNAPHPVHVHGVPFQVISRTGGRGRVFPWESGWKDTVLLEDGETVEVLINFDQLSGQEYVMHCHKLEHEDMGMMSNFLVENRP